MSSTSPKTVVVTTSVLAVLIVLQLGVAFTIFVRRAALVGPVQLVTGHSETPGVALATPVAPVATAATPSQSPFSGVSLPTPAMAKATPPPATARPSPAPTAAPDARETLVERCRDARSKGDMTGALAGLRSAEKLYPDDSLIVSELALTYEQMGLVDKALSQWKRVLDAGEKAGDLYGIAAEKLKTGVGGPAAAAGRDADGLQPGSTMGFADLQKEYTEAPDGSEQVSLQVAVKSRPSSTVTAGDVNIQVAFYDLLNNQEVEPTNAKITSDWSTAPADWLEDGIEILKVQYQQKARDSSASPEKSEDRKYLGYIVRVYYKNELQDVRAEPVKLLQYFPPPTTLQTQNEIPQ